MSVTHTPDYVEAMVSPQAPRGKLSQNPQLAPAERERLEIYEETWRDLEMRGFKPASIIRFAPWGLNLDGAAHNCLRLPGVPIEPDSWKTHQPRLQFANGLSVPYLHYVATTPYITVGTRFRGRGESDSYAEIRASVNLPIDLVRDMAHQQNLYKSQGGIVAYEGAELPQKSNGEWLVDGDKARGAWLTKDEHSVSLEVACHSAFERLMNHMKAVMDQATSAHLSQAKEELREIRGNRFRQAVQYLMNVGVIQSPPSWFQQRFDATTTQKTSKCPMCPKQVTPDTVKCDCGYILDPFKAYGHLYTEESDGGMLTARRMSQEQLKTLGLYPRIKPLAEHLEEMNKAARSKKDDKKNEAKKED